ncbi:hypothetical protein ISF_02538 [Cordyceps fumosorosea ARSEF 2679]|uniref:Uncharacterized protein n=1 Tax=Cordyceps fumosorosea (strain ARSEF 2679) TaxID=1081104 RepID=A0A162LH96_CORFA|nr:hypothetical protein ISF_02538 [Cordyceps fumosorosea ARSEF 2679]OAA70564.1 hypothetical protein ISF_02538 [Cordyceps fumosorosea ARSEF 2679]
MSPIFSGASDALSQNLTSSASLSASAAPAPTNLFMCFPVDPGSRAFLTNMTANSSITPPLTMINPLDALLDTSMRLHLTISPTPQTTTAATDTAGIASARATATPTTKATAMAEAALATTNPDAETAGRQAGKATVGQKQSAEPDPAKGPFPGGIPKATEDVLITAIFLILFALGAITHISIYRANAKRGHKFLLSDLMFDFCMVRVMTCIFRIVWAFSSPRGVVLAATIFQNGGAAVIFAVNLFLAQRIVRAMHPGFAWRPAFSYISLFLIFSVPAVIIMNVIATSFSFFSVGRPVRLEAAEIVLTFGASWNMMLVAMPLLWIFLAGAAPHPPPEQFGEGDLSRKASLVVFSATTLMVGMAVKIAAIANPESVAAMSPLFTKVAFYTTGFMLEIFTVAAYAYFRIDLLFHIPNGSSGPGDYSVRGEPQSWTAGEVMREIHKMGVRYELLSSQGGSGGKKGPLIAMFHLGSAEHDGAIMEEPSNQNPGLRKSVRVSRRQSFMEAIAPGRPPRATRSTIYMTEKLPPSVYSE